MRNTNACTQLCNQGRNCDCCPNSYWAQFDHLGNPIDQTPPFRGADLAIICIAMVGIVAFTFGVL